MKRWKSARSPAALLLLPGLVACPSEPGLDAGREGPDTASAAPERSGPGQVHSRKIVFVATGEGGSLLVPWIFTARTRPGVVDREARAWLDRAGSWELFFRERWNTAPTRAPWRLLPRGPFRLVVGEGDAIREIVYREGARNLELRLGAVRAEWSGPRGEQFQVQEGSAILSGERIDGVVFEARLVRRAEDPHHGDWAFLTSGDSAQVVLYDPSSDEPPAETSYRGLARVGAEEYRWPVLQVEWAAIRPFQQARRDVPVEWELRSPNGDLAGRLEVVTSELTAGEGEGPLLPVDGLFQVRGTVEMGGRELPVRGLFRHLQP